MMKQEYKKPNMVVVELKSRSCLLSGSPTPYFKPEETSEDMD